MPPFMCFQWIACGHIRSPESSAMAAFGRLAVGLADREGRTAEVGYPVASAMKRMFQVS